MQCLQILLNIILDPPSQDKVVVVSNSTAALDLIEAMCARHGYDTTRIDGATNVNKRQDIVNNFNSAYGQAQVGFFTGLVESTYLFSSLNAFLVCTCHILYLCLQCCQCCLRHLEILPAHEQLEPQCAVNACIE